VNTADVSRDDWILGGVALLLIIDLLFLPWFSVGGGSVGNIPIPSIDLTGTDAPSGWLGLLAVLALILVIVDLAVERFSPGTALPNIGGSRVMTRFVLGIAAVAFLFLKFVFNIHFSDFGFGFWLAVVLCVGLVYLQMQARNAGRTTITGTPTGAGTPTV
jgi:hypothetical protein